MYFFLLRFLRPLRRDFPLLLITPIFLFATAFPWYGFLSGCFLLLMSMLFIKSGLVSIWQRMAICFLLASLLGHFVGTEQLEVPSGWHHFSGKVTGMLRYRKPGQVEFGLLVQDARHVLDGAQVFCRAALLPWRVSSEVRTGNRVRIYARMRASGSLGRYGQFLLRRGFQGSCIVKAVALQDTSEEVLSLVRRQVVQRIYKQAGRSEDTGLLLAMTIGLRDQITRTTDNAFRQLGLSHVLILSGFQLTFLFGLCSSLSRRVLAPWPAIRHALDIQMLARGIGFFLVFLLLCLSGFEHSGTRAGVALLVGSFGAIFERRQKPMNVLLCSMLILTIVNPGCLMEVGVQLTCAALVGIILADGDDLATKSIAGVSFWCSVCTSCVVIWHFNGISLAGFFVNPILAPVFSLLGTQCGLASMLISWIGFEWPLQLVVWSLGQIKNVIVDVAQFSWMYMDFRGSPGVRLVVLAAGLLLVVNRTRSRVVRYYRLQGW